MKNIPIILIGFTIILLAGCRKARNETQPADSLLTAAGSDKETAVPVEVMILKKKNLSQKLELTGTIKPIHEVDIVAEVAGKVVRIEKELGQSVTPADTLAYIDDKIPYNQYRQARAQVMSARNNLRIAELNLASDKQLFDNGDISRLAYENSELAVKNARAGLLSALASFSLMEKQYFDTRITSPIPGVIARKYIDLGTMAGLNTPLFRVVDLSRLKITVGVPQDMVKHIHLNSPVSVSVTALGRRTFKGLVKFISPQADEATGAFNTEVQLNNSSNHILKAGMTARLSISLGERKEVLTIPEYALASSGGQPAVYVVNRGMASIRAVEIDETIGSNLVVASGLSEGDTVVVVGIKNLGINTPVRIESAQ